MKRDWKRKIIGGLCLTSVAFVFQACYGTPQDFASDLFIAGQVKSKTSGLPIKGIKVSVVDGIQYTSSDDNGMFAFYTARTGKVKISFTDNNILYSEKDTIVSINDSILSSKHPSLHLNIQLENK
jgi:hypothetical protein